MCESLQIGTMYMNKHKEMFELIRVERCTSTINDTYNQLVSTVGIKTSQANISMKSQGIVLEQSKLARDSVSGVNLDEEAADLLRYQQAYQAAAKVMAASDQMFKTLLNSLG